MSNWTTLRERVAAIDAPLSLVLSARRGDDSLARAARDLLDDLIQDNPQISLETIDGPEAAIITVTRDGADGPISFWGVPSGFELEALVLAMEASVRDIPTDAVPPEASSLIAQIPAPLTADLYVAPT